MRVGSFTLLSKLESLIGTFIVICRLGLISKNYSTPCTIERTFGTFSHPPAQILTLKMPQNASHPSNGTKFPLQ